MSERSTEPGRLRELIHSGIGITPPVIFWPGGGQPVGEGEVLVKSTDCGPKKVEATEKGEWNSDRSEARKSAREAARTAAKGTCFGGCGEGTECKYLETEGKTTGPEERQNPHNEAERQFRYEFTTRGTCQCE